MYTLNEIVNFTGLASMIDDTTTMQHYKNSSPQEFNDLQQYTAVTIIVRAMFNLSQSRITCDIATILNRVLLMTNQKIPDASQLEHFNESLRTMLNLLGNKGIIAIESTKDSTDIEYVLTTKGLELVKNIMETRSRTLSPEIEMIH